MVSATSCSCLVVLLLLVETSVSIDYPWDFFVFAQEWTPSVCIDSDQACSIPPQVEGWTVHGLWPSKFKEEKPNYCRPDMKFDWNKIKSLSPNLTAQWPNVFSKTPADDFWKHEWDKHGTCAITLNATGDEYLYFKKALQLNSMLNVTQVLKSLNVVPSNVTGYRIGDVISVLEKYYGKPPQISCGYDKKTKRQLMVQLELCFDKKFQLIVCQNGKQLKSEGECRSSEPTFLLPFTKTNQKKPEFTVVNL